jgi:V/A-type H+-transporting ATPase subunit G/H
MMDATQDGIEQIHAAEEAARARIEEAEKRARAVREEADKESRTILQQAEENANREATRILEGVTKDSSKVEGKIQNETEAHIQSLISSAEKKKKDAVKAAMKILLEEE